MESQSAVNDIRHNDQDSNNSDYNNNGSSLPDKPPFFNSKMVARFWATFPKACCFSHFPDVLID